MTRDNRSSERMSAAEVRAEMAKPKRSKYGARKTVLDGIKFDSKAEANYYAALKQRETAGEVYEVDLQPPFALTVNGHLVATYRADFQFWDSIERRTRVVDVKGFDTPVSKLKRKMVKALYGVDVEIVK
jgi:hypothetical protein